MTAARPRDTVKVRRIPRDTTGGEMVRTKTDTMVEEITLHNKAVRLVHKDLPIREVHLNPDNQRVQYIISLLGYKPGEDELERELWEIDEVKKLCQAVRTNGGLIERIIVAPEGSVIEGNCRTVVYRKLHEREAGDARWESIPARVLPDDITDEQIAILLGEMHVAGKNQWDGFERAGYIHRMNGELGFSLEYLAELLGRSKTTIKNLRDAYVLMRDTFLVNFPGKDNVYKFTYFEQFFRRVKSPSDDLKARFCDWVGTGKLYDRNQVRSLPELLELPDAVEALEKGGFDAAMHLLSGRRPELTSALFKTMERTIKELQTAPLGEIEAIRTGDKAKAAKLEELHKALVRFASYAGVKLAE